MDVRWKQRFNNFENAFLFFEKAVDQPNYTLLEMGGLVQSFEFTFELAWKTIKDYLESEGMDIKSPKEAIKAGFSTEIIEDGHIWIEMLEKRNELSHTYNQHIANQAVEFIKYKYYPAVEQVYRYFKNTLK